MRHSLAGLAFVLALGAAPAFAANVSGFYAGIYGGTAMRSDSNAEYTAISGFFDGPGTIETPTSIVNDGVDPRLFAVLSQVLAEFPFADFGVGGGVVGEGVLAFERAPLLGFAVGYGLGNGLRIEADYAATTQTATTFAFTGGIFGGAFGEMLSDGTWEWSDTGGSSDIGPEAPVPIAFITGADTFYTRAEFLLLNAWYDFDTGTAVTPYLGGGAGVAKITTLASTTCTCDGVTLLLGQDSAYVPAAQLGGGLKVQLGGPVSLDFGYRMKIAAGSDVGFTYVDTDFFPGFEVLGVHQSGMIINHTLQAGLTFALN